jgi:hypothetical protein
MNEETIKCIESTVNHINRVRELLMLMVEDLLERAKIHDESKLREPELSVFAKHQDALATTTYGTKEYDELRDKVKVAIDHHYAKNRHHPEHHKNGVNDMTLLDLVEMLADWIASSERNKNGNIRHSLEVNSKRFGLSEQMIKIMENTVKEMDFNPKG